ncbi:potential protein lysine methyltransferase SET6-like [Contarinia nasturtii]|uniref:potential protein lysine methyltransferase SET6-like n=1 Tax=Contarinia nasturtii TaxID=265458 RepID=UPI0012D41C54|nr:potential protein lysine methyltransferase SET6-like [Contarinia nasturtii]
MSSDYGKYVWQKHAYGAHRQFYVANNEISDEQYQEFKKVLATFNNERQHHQHFQIYKGDKFPCFQKVNVGFESDSTYGRFLKANQSIHFNQEVFKSAPFASAVEPTSHQFCLTCHKVPSQTEHDTFIQCSQCINVFFCCIQCKIDNQSHKFECDTIFRHITDLDIKLSIQMVLEAMTLFATVNQLQSYIERIVDDKTLSQSIPVGCFDKVARLDCIMRLCPSPLDQKICEKASLAYKFVMEIPVIKMNFKLKSQTRFLKHLLMHFLGVIDANAIVAHIKVSKSTQLKRLLIYEVFSFFNHSCCPNVFYYLQQNNNVMIGRANHTINQNEQLFINYEFFYDNNTEERRQYIEENWKFICHCNRCEQDVTEESRQRAEEMSLDELKTQLNTTDMTTWRRQHCAYILRYMQLMNRPQLNIR